MGTKGPVSPVEKTAVSKTMTPKTMTPKPASATSTTSPPKAPSAAPKPTLASKAALTPKPTTPKPGSPKSTTPKAAGPKATSTPKSFRCPDCYARVVIEPDDDAKSAQWLHGLSGRCRAKQTPKAEKPRRKERLEAMLGEEWG